MKQKSAKSLQSTFTSLCFSIAKSTLQDTLTFNKAEKTKYENLDIVHLFSSFCSSSRITQNLYGVYRYYAFSK